MFSNIAICLHLLKCGHPKSEVDKEGNRTTGRKVETQGIADKRVPRPVVQNPRLCGSGESSAAAKLAWSNSLRRPAQMRRMSWMFALNS